MTERCPYFVSGCRCGLHARHRGVCQVVEDWQPKRDSTPPATPVEPPEHGWCDVCPVCGGHPHCPDHGDRRASNPPAVLGDGERLKEQAAAYRAIALDALACWQGEDDHSDDALKRNRSARSRATLRHRICAVDDTVRASTPTPGTPR